MGRKRSHPEPSNCRGQRIIAGMPKRTSNCIRFCQVDAFTAEPFSGNPAGVFIIDELNNQHMPDERKQKFAFEQNLSECAFITLRGTRNPFLQWFTPNFEIDLCGHATIAASHAFFTMVVGLAKDGLGSSSQEVTFDTKWVGQLKIMKPDLQEPRYCMSFPYRPGRSIDVNDKGMLPDWLLAGIFNKQPGEEYPRPIAATRSRDLILVYEEASSVQTADVNCSLFRERNVEMVAEDLQYGFKKQYYECVIAVTAKGAGEYADFDFVSRVWCPDDVNIEEDPVTGSVHSTLAPVWSVILSAGVGTAKTKMKAKQISKRGGELELEIVANHNACKSEASYSKFDDPSHKVLITGSAVTVLRGEVEC